LNQFVIDAFTSRKKNSFLFLILLCLAGGSCVDRVSFDIPEPDSYPVVVDGFIHDYPGPYQVTITKAFDIESKTSPRTPISVRQIEISDNVGNTERLFQISQGVYQTQTNGIQGTVGRAYTLKIELLDGRKFQSLPDTLHPSGIVDSVYTRFITSKDANGATEYSFDVLFNASVSNQDNYHFMWKFFGTYEAQIPCCTCWAFIQNEIPIISDGQLIEGGHFNDVLAGTVPVNGWTFMNKVFARVIQFSLSPNAFHFWKQVRDQKLAEGSLFQTISGRITNNFFKVGKKGPQNEMYGIFYATSITSRGIWIERSDVPSLNMIPKIELAPATDNYDPTKRPCSDFFPGSTTVRPSYWKD